MKKGISVILTLTMLVSILGMSTFALPSSPVVAGASGDIGDMNALDALGIDTSVLPEGYDPNSIDNPYGRTQVTINPVYELFTTEYNSSTSELDLSLYGHNQTLNQTMTHFYASQRQAVSVEPPFAPLLATASASGNFLGTSAAGKTGQVVTVGIGGVEVDDELRMSPLGGLYLYFTDPVTGVMSAEPKVLIPPGDSNRVLGNSGGQMEEDFHDNPNLVQNYLKIATGDFNNDGTDEVAVYVAERENSRVEIYQMYRPSGADPDEAYLNTSFWTRVWTYYFNESPYVSNMVSLTVGDLNRNGTDDLALTWGYYYGPQHQTPSQAVVLYGDNLTMFQKRKTIELKYNTARIVRAAFAHSDVTGDNVPELILGGQLATDIAAGKMNTRFVGIYTYEGFTDQFIPIDAVNFDLFEKNDQNQPVHLAIGNRSPQVFYSSPGGVANITTMREDGIGTAASIYLDSLLIRYNASQELEIAAALDVNWQFNPSFVGYQPRRYYVEYGAAGGDFTGDSKETLQVMQYYLPLTTTSVVRYWWWPINYYYTTDYPPQLDLVGLYAEGTALKSWRRADLSLSASFCRLNTDSDTALLTYTGTRFLVYTDPEVLAVLASPPYFADLNNPDLSNDYMGSQTSFRSSQGSGASQSHSHTIKAGIYVSFEQEFKLFGISGAKFEMELAYTYGHTWGTTQSRMMEQSITYSTPAGSDSVAFYSIPMEVYVYESVTPIIDEATGEITGYQTQQLNVNIPHPATVKVLPLNTYERIAADYAELPQIAGSILTHTVGLPSSYPSRPHGYRKALVYDGIPAGVGYGGGSIAQEILMTSATEKSYTHSHTFDFKAGLGAGGLVVGFTLGYEYGHGRAEITTSGSTFTGQVNNMPIEAEPYGYSYAWRVFSYEHSSAGRTFPVVSYLVTGVVAPPKLPADFRQDTAKTTDTTLTVTWSYNGPASYFEIYRYYEFPDGSGSYEVGTVPAYPPLRIDPDGTRHFEYQDTGLHPYTDYSYQIQVVGASQPTHSIPSRVHRFRTKTDVGYPVLLLNGLTSTSPNRLDPVYPDSVYQVEVEVKNIGIYTQPPKYQWQKLTEAGWINIGGATNPSYIFRNAGLADEGQYRCRVNVIYEQYYISDYSEVFALGYSKRTPEIRSFTVVDAGGSDFIPSINLSLGSVHYQHFTRPTGQVTFEVVGADYRQSHTVPLIVTSGVTLAGEADADIIWPVALPEGAYEITAFYGGNRVYQSLISVPEPYLAGTGTGYLVTVDSIFTYGDSMDPVLKRVVKDNGETRREDIVGDITYLVIPNLYEPWTYWYWSNYRDWLPDLSPIGGFVDGDMVQAYQAGGFLLIAQIDGQPVAHKKFLVDPRDVIIGIQDQIAMAEQSGLVHPDHTILRMHPETPLVFADTIADLGLAVRATDTAGTEREINETTPPGSYQIVGIPGQGSTTSVTYLNYAITFMAGEYILTGPTFAITGTAALLNDKTVGAIQQLTPVDNEHWTQEYSPGTGLVFQASPNRGYDVKRWVVRDALGGILHQDGSTKHLHYTMPAEAIAVTVDFEVAQRRLIYTGMGGDNRGLVECISNTVIQSGHVAMMGAEFTFKAVPAAGYSFLRWELYELGKATTYPTGTPGAGGTNTCEIVMGTGETHLYAVFARDSYQITLTGDLLAVFYEVVDVEPVRREVSSGAWIRGDSEVKIIPKLGYAVLDNAVWTQDGQPVSADVDSGNQSYTFTMVANTAIAVQTQVGHFDVDFALEGPGNTNAVLAKVNGVTRDPYSLTNITGGSSLEFTAVPGYGYLFDKWVLNGEDRDGETLNITVGENVTLRAVFKDNEAYIVSVLHGLRGSVAYRHNDGESTPLASGGVIPVFAGDTVVVTATPEINFMVEHWWINSILHQTTVKTQTFQDINEDLNVFVAFGAQTYSTVTYTAGPGGSVSAKSDGVAFESGSRSVGNGSEVEFIAAPDPGFMLEEWRLNDVVVNNALGQPLLDTTFCIPALSGDANVTVAFKEIVTRMVQFTDTNTATTVQYVPAAAFVADDEVQHGATAIFTVTPESGFGIASVSVTGNAGTMGGFDSITKQPDGTWVCVVNAVTDDLEVTAEATQLYSVAVALSPGGSITLGANSAIEGAVITLQASASLGYQFSSWTVESEPAGIDIDVANVAAANTEFTMPASDVVVSASFTFSGFPSPPIPPQPPAPVSSITVTTSQDGTTKTLSVNIEATVDDETGKAFAVVDDALMAELMAEAQALVDGGYKVVIEINVESSQVQAMDVEISETSFAALLDIENASLRVDTGIAAVTFDPQALETVGAAAGNVVITTEAVDHDTLSVEAQATVGDRPVYSFGVKAGDVSVADFGDGTVTVRIPYTLQPGEQENSVVVYYVDDEGELKTVTGMYEAATGTVVFTTSHFSVFAVGYNEVNFVDVGAQAWYYEAVGFMAARSIVRGVGDNQFAPEGQVIRADFLIMVMNAYGLEADLDLEENFDDAGDRYYTPYLATAKALGLVQGVGNNHYLPEATISRQDMFVILYRMLSHMAELPVTLSSKTLDDFADAADIADYAMEAMRLFVETDTVRGDGSQLTPRATSTRAQAVQVLYNLLSNF